MLIKHPCIPPNILRHITPVDYTKCDLVEWFWERLARSLEESSYCNPDDVAALIQGPPAIPMPQGTLQVSTNDWHSPMPRSNSSSSSNTTSNISNTTCKSRTAYTSSMSMPASSSHTTSELSASSSMESVNHAESVTDNLTSSTSYTSMDVDNTAQTTSTYHMPAPSKSSKKGKKKGFLAKFQKKP